MLVNSDFNKKKLLNPWLIETILYLLILWYNSGVFTLPEKPDVLPEVVILDEHGQIVNPSSGQQTFPRGKILLVS